MRSAAAPPTPVHARKGVREMAAERYACRKHCAAAPRRMRVVRCMSMELTCAERCAHCFAHSTAPCSFIGLRACGVFDCAAAQFRRDPEWGNDAFGIRSRVWLKGAAAPRANVPLRERRSAQRRSAAHQLGAEAPLRERRSAQRRSAAHPAARRRGAPQRPRRRAAHQLGGEAP